MKRTRCSWCASSVCALLVALPAAAAPPAASTEPRPTTTPTQTAPTGEALYGPIHRVLLSPRCKNCHPAGDAPLQGDEGRVHAQNVSRRLLDLGLTCETCHRATLLPGANGPPAAPHWAMPPRDMPMVFVGRSEAELCAQLKDPLQNGHRTPAALAHHMIHDPLVLWGFEPGPGRTKPPLTHAAFASAVEAWTAAGQPCPPLAGSGPQPRRAKPAATKPAATRPPRR